MSQSSRFLYFFLSMSSSSNDIHADIRALLGTDTLTPEMERVLSVMWGYRPQVTIDANYRKRLKNTLLSMSKKSSYTRPSWFTWMSWAGTSFAALIVTLGIVRVLFPEEREVLEQISTRIQTPLPQDAWASQDNPPLTHISETPDDMVPTGSAIPRSDDTLSADISTDTSADMGLAMATAVGPTLAKTALPDATTTMSVPLSDAPWAVDSEIQDMVWEINSIIGESWSASTLILPEYPTEMPIYSKDGVFTPEELSLLAGSGITSRGMATYSPDVLQSLITDRRGTLTLTGSPIIRYRSRQIWAQYMLIPTVIYTTATWGTLEVPLVSGY